MKGKQLKPLFFVCIFLAILSSCSKEEDVVFDIELPPAPIDSGSENWAVINSSYLRLREYPEQDANLVTTLFKGYVLSVKSKSLELSLVDKKNDFWYRVSYDGLTGWVFGAYLDVFNNKEDAEIRSRTIRAD